MYQNDYKRVDAETLIQLQDGRIDISDDGNVTLMRAGSAGSKVGKSTYSTAINTTDNSGLVTAEFDFMIPDGMPTSHIYLADIESKAASSGYNPGVRIQVRDGIIRVERGKIGIKELWPADMDELQTGTGFRRDRQLDAEIGAGKGVPYSCRNQQQLPPQRWPGHQVPAQPIGDVDTELRLAEPGVEPALVVVSEKVNAQLVDLGLARLLVGNKLIERDVIDTGCLTLEPGLDFPEGEGGDDDQRSLSFIAEEIGLVNRQIEQGFPV